MKKPLLYVLGWYQQYRGLRPDACRFDPTCSSYAVEAIEVHGSLKGLYLGFRRVLRCHPLGGRGYDPVPASPSSAPPVRPVRGLAGRSPSPVAGPRVARASELRADHSAQLPSRATTHA